MKSFHDLLEKSALPILVIILIPIGFIAYAIWGTNTAPSSVPSAVAPTTSATPTVTISLNDASALPQTVAAGQFVPFSFTITNTGSVAGDIAYKVSVKWSTGESDVIDVNSIPLSSGKSAVINESLKFEVADETAQVFLELTQSGQTVQFALPKSQ